MTSMVSFVLFPSKSVCYCHLRLLEIHLENCHIVGLVHFLSRKRLALLLKKVFDQFALTNACALGVFFQIGLGR